MAVKVLPADKVADAERMRRFVLEAKAASGLNHPDGNQVAFVWGRTEAGVAVGDHFDTPYVQCRL